MSIRRGPCFGSAHRLQHASHKERLYDAAECGSSLGALAVEYGLCMLIAALMMVGIQDLFWDMSKEVLDTFMSWISKPYP